MGFDKLTAGLSHCDLYYKRYDGSEPAGDQAEDPSLMIQPLQDFAFSVKTQVWAIRAVRELVFPGAMVEMKAGKGRLILDQRRWMADDSRVVRYAQRNLTSLAMGLGVGVAPVATPRELPRDVAFNPWT